MSSKKKTQQPKRLKIFKYYEYDEELLKAALEENSALLIDELAVKLRSIHITIYRHFQQIDKVPKLGK